MKTNKLFKFSITLFVLQIVFLILANMFIIPCNNKVHKKDVENVTYKKFEQALNNEQIKTIYLNDNEDTFYYETNSKEIFTTINPKYESFKKDILKHDVLIKPVHEYNFAENTEDKRSAIVTLISVIVAIINFFLLLFSQKTEDTNASLFKKKCATTENNENVVFQMNGKGKITEESNEGSIKKFKDIAGLSEVKRDMKCLVDFLVNKKKYQEAGAKLPKGVILYGPPGTGKTLLAKAVAGEANIPFIYASGSQFIEMYVGMGAKRVREIFANARKLSPCIIFIDEIDAIGGKRSNRESSGEDRKTVNALLTEMDGFKESENIMVIAATNRLEDLDEALTRPGRFTDKFCVPLPETAKERMEVIDLYTKNKKINETVDLDELAKETIGFSPAAIESILNEAAIISVQKGQNSISKEHIDEAMYKALLQGHVRESIQDQRSEEELRTVAWHEAGHAIIGKLKGKDITKVTLLSSTSGAGGVTFSTPLKTTLLNVQDLKEEVMELYGGRIAELLLFNNDHSLITTGASNDIDRATNIIHEIITKYGMSEEFGYLNLTNAGVDKEFILQKEIELAKELEKKTYDVLKAHYQDLKYVAELLLEKETIYDKDLEFLKIKKVA